MKRYAAKLLFQWCLLRKGKSNIRRMCEERTIVLKARSAPAAIAKARRRGQKATFRTTNLAGYPLFFEFVGVVDMVHLGVECDDDEVWYTIREFDRPMERKGKLTKSDRQLLRPVRWTPRRQKQFIDLAPAAMKNVFDRLTGHSRRGPKFGRT